MYVFFVLNLSTRPTRTKLRTNPQHQHLQVSTWIHLNIPTIQLTFHRREASTKSTRTNAPNEPQKRQNKTKNLLVTNTLWICEFSNGNISGASVCKEYPLPLFTFATFKESGENLGSDWLVASRWTKYVQWTWAHFDVYPYQTCENLSTKLQILTSKVLRREVHRQQH